MAEYFAPLLEESNGNLLILADQFEELFSQRKIPQELAHHFVKTLDILARSGKSFFSEGQEAQRKRNSCRSWLPHG